jgi:surfeit locus 1 family protein
MSRRTIVFCVLAGLAAVVFIRLGFWQLARLHEKVQRNEEIIRQQREKPVAFGDLPRDTAAAHYRPARVTGRFDYSHELSLSGRTHQGSPGVELLTPLRLAGNDTAVLVNRGWVYAPDGATADRARWHESDSASVSGYIEQYMPDAGVTTATTDPSIVRRVSRQEIAAKIPYPLAPYYLVSTSDTADGAHPARHTIPALDEGPHRSYAIQWFFFALVALAGAAMIVLRERFPR